MSLEVLALGLFSALRPGTSLAAVLALLKTPRPQRPLLFFIVAGLAWTWVVGLLVVAVFHGANVALGGSKVTAALDVALGAAALGFAAGVQRGSIQTRRRTPAKPGPDSPLGRRLRNPSAGVAAAAGVGTHLPGLIYLAALNVIASERPGPVSAGVQVALYDALWFLIPLAALALVVLRPGAALVYLEDGTAWAQRHERVLLVGGALVLGAYLIAKGLAALI